MRSTFNFAKTSMNKLRGSAPRQRMPNLFGRTARTSGLLQTPRFGFTTMEKTFLADDLQIIERKELKPKPGPDH